MEGVSVLHIKLLRQEQRLTVKRTSPSHIGAFSSIMSASTPTVITVPRYTSALPPDVSSWIMTLVPDGNFRTGVSLDKLGVILVSTN